MVVQTNSPARTLELSIAGMTCGGCAGTLVRVLMRVPGVERAEVDHRTGRALVTGTAPVEKLTEVVEAAGYGARGLSAGSAEEVPNERGRSGCC